VSESRHTSGGGSSGAPEAALLSPRRAFVVQFRGGTGAARERFAGRVEHIASGRAARFHSPGALRAFFAKILGTVQD
jgi:hypothetical protein